MAIAGSQACAGAVEALRPVLSAERRRGNFGSMRLGDIHDTRPWWQMRYPLDIRAIEAEFQFGDRIELRTDDGGRIVLLGSTGGNAFAVAGGSGETWWTRRRRAAWWREWEASPRPRSESRTPSPLTSAEAHSTRYPSRALVPLPSVRHVVAGEGSS